MEMPIDLFGFAAAFALLLAVSLTNIVAIRVAMLSSNILFIAWGAMGMLLPALVLNCTLLPINLLRLWQLFKTRNATRRKTLELPADQTAWARDPLSHPSLRRMTEVELADLQFRPEKVLSE